MSAGAALARAAHAIKKRVARVFEPRTEGHLQLDYKTVFYHRYRLTSDGKAQLACVDLILSETVGRFGPGSTKFSRHILIKEFAAVACLAERAIQKALKDLCARGVIQREGKESEDGNWEVTDWGWRCCIDQWPKLKDYTPPAPTQLSLVEEPEVDGQDGEQTTKPCTESRDLPPIMVRAGRPSQARKLFEGLKHRTISNREVEVRHRIYGSELIETYLTFPDEAKSSAPHPNGHIKDGLNGHAPPESSPHRRHGPAAPGWQSFLALAIEAGFRTTEVLVDKAEQLFQIKAPTVEAQIAACRGLRAQIDAGDYPNPTHPKQIDRYVEDKMWQAAPRAKPMSAAELREAATNSKKQQQLAWARDMDEKLAKRKS